MKSKNKKAKKIAKKTNSKLVKKKPLQAKSKTVAKKSAPKNKAKTKPVKALKKTEKKTKNSAQKNKIKAKTNKLKDKKLVNKKVKTKIKTAKKPVKKIEKKLKKPALPVKKTPDKKNKGKKIAKILEARNAKNEKVAKEKIVKIEVNNVVDLRAKFAEKKVSFKINDYVIYPSHGIGKIIDIETTMVLGQDFSCYLMYFEKEKLTIKVPLKNAENIGLRPLASKEQMDEVFTILRSGVKKMKGMWSRRAQEYESKINSGNIIELAEVLRDLARDIEDGERSYSERIIYETAVSRLAAEYGAVYKVDAEAAKEAVISTAKDKLNSDNKVVVSDEFEYDLPKDDEEDEIEEEAEEEEDEDEEEEEDFDDEDFDDEKPKKRRK